MTLQMPVIVIQQEHIVSTLQAQEIRITNQNAFPVFFHKTVSKTIHVWKEQGGEHAKNV